MHQEILIPFGVFAFVTAIVTIVTVTKHAGRNREYAHQERLRALELGQPLHGGTFWPSMAAISIGAVVPVASFVFAFLTNLLRPGSEEAWVFAGVVSTTAVGCGTFLAARLLHKPENSPTNWDTSADWQAGKPAVDPDAYDTVGQRG